MHAACTRGQPRFAGWDVAGFLQLDSATVWDIGRGGSTATPSGALGGPWQRIDAPSRRRAPRRHDPSGNSIGLHACASPVLVTPSCCEVSATEAAAGPWGLGLGAPVHLDLGGHPHLYHVNPPLTPGQVRFHFRSLRSVLSTHSLLSFNNSINFVDRSLPSFTRCSPSEALDDAGRLSLLFSTNACMTS